MDRPIFLQVGPWRVEVRVVAERPRVQGKPCDAAIFWDVQRVSIWSRITGRRRMNLLWHELWHLKRHHLGISADSEIDCKVSSAFVEDVQSQLDDQGGRAAVLALQPVDLLASAGRSTAGCDPATPTLVAVGDEFSSSRTFEDDEAFTPSRLGGAPSADCAEPACGREFFASDILTGPVHWCGSVQNRVVAGDVVEREVFCPECGVLQVWLEGHNPILGIPNGVAVALLERTPDADRINNFHRRLHKLRRDALRPPTPQD